MEAAAKYLLLALLLLPFIALYSDATGRTRNIMIKAVLVAAVTSTLLVFVLINFQRRPVVANVFTGAFLIWPVLLLAAKKINPAISWEMMWGALSVMGWYLLNVSMRLDYPVDGAGGGFGMAFTFAVSWLYLPVLFAVMWVFVSGIEAITQRLRTKK